MRPLTQRGQRTQYLFYLFGNSHVFGVKYQNSYILSATARLTGRERQFHIYPDTPYKGEKPHYVLNIENQEHTVEIARIIELVTPLPKPKKRK